MKRWKTGTPKARAAIIRGTLSVAALFIITLLVGGCAWNLTDDPTGGALTIDFRRTSGLGTQNLSDEFQELTFFVVEADYFRDGGTSVGVGPNVDPVVRAELLAAGSPALEEFGQPQPLAGAPGTGERVSVPGGVARYFDSENLPTVSSVRFEDLDVGTEYVIWIDGDTSDFGLRLGFTTTRIRAGAETSVSIDLSADRFAAFVETLYERYVEPFLPPPQPIDLGEFSYFEYAGTGSVTTTVDGEETETVLDRGDIGRILFEFEDGTAFNAFYLFFYASDPGDQSVEVFVYILDTTSAVEPKRSSYTLDIFGEDATALPDAGTIYYVDMLFASGEREYYLLGDPPPNLATAGFTGGAPSSGGRFDFGVSGTFEETFDGTTVAGEITDLSFTYGELLASFEELPD